MSTETLIGLTFMLAPFIPIIINKFVYKKYTNAYTLVGIMICFIGLFVLFRGLLDGLFRGGQPNIMKTVVGLLIYAIGFILQILKV